MFPGTKYQTIPLRSCSRFCVRWQIVSPSWKKQRCNGSGWRTVCSLNRTRTPKIWLFTSAGWCCMFLHFFVGPISYSIFVCWSVTCHWNCTCHILVNVGTEHLTHTKVLILWRWSFRQPHTSWYFKTFRLVFSTFSPLHTLIVGHPRQFKRDMLLAQRQQAVMWTVKNTFTAI